jgi:hypothetical protein
MRHARRGANLSDIGPTAELSMLTLAQMGITDKIEPLPNEGVNHHDR